MDLSFEQGRVIGCLVEKQLTTPQQYPLTLNALVLACNQSSNRDPVVSYEEGLVQCTLASLKEAGLVRFVYPSSGRSATRYRQVIGESLRLEDARLALLAVLLLRGPQTAGELRTRTERMAPFDGLGSLNAELENMAARAEPLVLRMPRRPGQKEERWVQLLTPDTLANDQNPVEIGSPYGIQLASGDPAGDSGHFGEQRLRTPSEDRNGDLADELALLRSEVAELREAVGHLQSQIGPD